MQNNLMERQVEDTAEQLFWQATWYKRGFKIQHIASTATKSALRYSSNQTPSTKPSTRPNSTSLFSGESRVFLNWNSIIKWFWPANLY